MKLHFEPDLDYQLQAIEAVCDLFRGQDLGRSELSIAGSSAQQAGNHLILPGEQLLKNLHAIQLRNGLRPSEALESTDFTVEMETGTGKTYVYLRTLFELNKRFGFSKFVVVVPSVAIKEGVYKSLQVTEEHFKALYAGVPFDYFLYDSAKLGQVRNFAASSTIQILVVTVGAINKKEVNNLYKESEQTSGEKPIELIRETRPILIVDEPQSVDGGLEGRGKEALEAMNPLCTLRYSATHVDQHHRIFRLDAIDAYERQLVKQIEVASATVEETFNRPFVRLISASSKKGAVGAKVELDLERAGKIRRQEVSVRDGEDLEATTGRAIYRDCHIGTIRVGKGRQSLVLRAPGRECLLNPGQAFGDADRSAVQRLMIRRTIQEHLDKERRLRPLGIKVLSLFFVDAVDKYRQHDADGNPKKGEYARVFEEEYCRLTNQPDGAEEVHGGYFSVDKRKVGGRVVEELRDTRGDSRLDDDTYNLIMKDKERLLSFDTPLRFIFSHSALREGWDNPNVFQICALREIGTERERRQTVGRGLRLCVNQQGERVRGFEVNTLTVIATERYEDFAQNLQRELEEETGIRFGLVEDHQFAALSVVRPEAALEVLGIERSRELWKCFAAQGYFDAEGKVQESLRSALGSGDLSLPEPFTAYRREITAVLRKACGRLRIKNAAERIDAPRNTDSLPPALEALWDRIKRQSSCRIQFDPEKLVEDCIRAVRAIPSMAEAHLRWRTAELRIHQAGVEVSQLNAATAIAIDDEGPELPDLLTGLEERTHLTRRALQRILAGSGRLADFTRNPQRFVEAAAEAIDRCKRLALGHGIKYQRLGDSPVFAQELMEPGELADHIESASSVFAELPDWFSISTPLGRFRPDCAVLVQSAEGERLYLCRERHTC